VFDDFAGENSGQTFRNKYMTLLCKVTVII